MPSPGSYPPESTSPASAPPFESYPASSSRRTALSLLGTGLVGSLAGCGALRGGSDPEAYHGGDWLSYGNGPRNANRVGGGLPVPTDHEYVAAADWTHTPPVVHDGVVYFASDREVVAVEPDGTEQWSSSFDVDVTGAPALETVRGYVYVPMGDSVTALSMTDGMVVWTDPLEDGRTYGVTVVEGDPYVRTDRACIRYSPDGTQRWRHSLDPLVYDEYNLGDTTATQIAPAVTENAVYVPDRHALVKLDRETGERRWRVAVDTPYAAAVVGDGYVVQTGWQETVAVDTDGAVRWRRDLHSRASAAVADGDVYVVAHDLHELDAETGETNWNAHLPGEGTAAPVVSDESVLVATGDVRVFRRERDGYFPPDRKRGEYSTVHATTFTSPVVAGGRVFVVAPSGLVALTATSDG